MLKGDYSRIAILAVCVSILVYATPAYPSYNSEAGRKHGIASKRLADLKKNSKRQKYRSYWIDTIRTFELVEKKYPKSPHAAESCFDRAGIYIDLYRHSKSLKDINDSIQQYSQCQAKYPKHSRSPEALYHVIDLSLKYKKDSATASRTFSSMNEKYQKSTWTKKAKSRVGTVTVQKPKPEPQIKKMPSPVIASAEKNKQPLGTVKSVRYWSGGAHTRIVIDQDKTIQFQAHELKKPDRLVFDLFNANLDPAIKDALPINDGILLQIRAGQYAPDVVRIVLDLASIKSYIAFPLREPDRLVIDIKGEEARSTETTASSTQTPTQKKTETAKVHSSVPQPKPKKTTIPKMPEIKNNDGEKFSLSSQMGLKIKTIAIDAGHGGHDAGAIGKNGLQEKMVTLDIAKRLAKLVKERLGCNVVMTRNKDVFVPLDKRPFIAKSREADMFVSIHANAHRKRKTKGIETYIQSITASDREAMATAARENAMTTKKLSELESEVNKMLAALKQDNKLEDSLQLAHAVQGSLVDYVKPIQPKVVNLGVKRAFFYVLINTEMPSILAEVGFISNPDEEKLLRKESYRQKIAESLYQGVKKFIDARSPQMMGI